MTNAEKYLKDGVDRYQFAKEIQDCFGEEIPLVDETILDWLADDSKPTLTEDERVILRNIPKEYPTIARNSVGEISARNDNDWKYADVFNHLFQFIKNGEEYSIKELLDNEDTTN